MAVAGCCFAPAGSVSSTLAEPLGPASRSAGAGQTAACRPAVTSRPPHVAGWYRGIGLAGSGVAPCTLQEHDNTAAVYGACREIVLLLDSEPNQTGVLSD